jgi:hypothetical protein
MSQKILILFLCLIPNIVLNSQNNDQQKLEIAIKTGFTQYTTTDQLLNYYNYKGYSGIPVNIQTKFETNHFLYSLSVFYHKSKLNPINANDYLYDYNYVKFLNLSFDLDIFYQITNNVIKIYLGARNNLYSVVQEENFKSLLYYNVEKRKSYDFSLYNFSPSILLACKINKSKIQLKAGLVLLNLSARPDDNFIKQTGYKSDFGLQVLSLKKYTSSQFEFKYTYMLNHEFSLVGEFQLDYRSFRNTDNYRYLQKSFLIGVSKTF